MDGVLVDTEPIHIRAFCELMDEMGIIYEQSYVHGFVGYSIADNMRRINRDFLTEREMDIERCVEKRDTIYLNLIRSQPLQPLPGIPELAAFCRQHHIRLALASSSDRLQIDTILNNLKENGYNLWPNLAAIVSGNDVAQRKPQGDIYRLILKKLNCAPQKALAVEDSEAGVQSAVSAAITCLALKNPFVPDQRLSQAAALINNVSEFVQLLQAAL